MATARKRLNWVLIGFFGLVAFLVWFVSGQFLIGIAALLLLIGMAGGALLYRFGGPPKR